MKILFFSYLSYDNKNYKGGGWVNSLIATLSEFSNYDIGIAYLTSQKNTCKFKRKGVDYFPIYRKISFLTKVSTHVLKRLEVIRMDDTVDSIVSDFKPDIIQLFGLETPFGSILANVKGVPVVVHIQGICTACIEKFYPIGMSPRKIWWNSCIQDKLSFMTANDIFVRYTNRAKLEQSNFKNYKYYLGRTDWDFSVSRMLSQNSTYFTCDEMLRPEFYTKKWRYKERDKIVISSTMNGDIYKGLDTILKAAYLLEKSKVSFEWNIYGITDKFPLKRVFEKMFHLAFSDNHVYFKGKKDADELVECLLESTFYIHPSHIDNSPNSLCEAMILGIPCIATYVGGIPSLLENGKNGFLVQDSGSYEIAFIVLNNYNNKALLESLSENVQEDARNRHNRGRVLAQLTNAYQNIIKDFSK
jgi:glycosyltransferase involved in cell wall biosynthesis